VPGLEDVPVLLEEYERLFVGPGQVPCPPYESFWRRTSPSTSADLMGRAPRNSRRSTWSWASRCRRCSGELPDHIAIELEAMAYALSFDETEPMARRLFDKHLAAVAAKAVPGRRPRGRRRFLPRPRCSHARLDSGNQGYFAVALRLMRQRRRGRSHMR